MVNQMIVLGLVIMFLIFSLAYVQFARGGAGAAKGRQGMSNFFKKTIGLILVVLFILFLPTVPKIFQEGNPIPVAIAVYKISYLGESIVQIDNNPETYLVNTYNPNGADEPFMKLKREQGFVFKDRGIGPYYEGNGHYYRMDFRAFTRKYLVIEVNEFDYASYPDELN